MSNDQIKLTSNDPVFDDIRPCRDDEVQSELKKIVSDDLVLNSILKFRYPVAYKPFSFILKPLVKAYLSKKIKNIKTIRDFQLIVADFVKNMSEKTTDGGRGRGRGREVADQGGYAEISPRLRDAAAAALRRRESARGAQGIFLPEPA